MRTTITIATLVLSSVVPLRASDTRAPGTFLRDYVAALQLTRAGDSLKVRSGCAAARLRYLEARELIKPYAIDERTQKELISRRIASNINAAVDITAEVDRRLAMAEATTLFSSALDAREGCAAVPATSTAGQLTDSAIKASRALIASSTAARPLAIDNGERKRAIQELAPLSGRALLAGNNDERDLEVAASALTYVLTHPPRKERGPDWAHAIDFERAPYHH